MRKIKGFTLIEMLLVLVIIGSFIYMGTNYFQQKATQARIDKTVMDMQQILNAAMAYYVANGSWPEPTSGVSIEVDDTLNVADPFYKFRQAYLPKANILDNMRSAWQAGYGVVVANDPNNPSNNTLFYVWSRINTGSFATSNAYATQIASRLPNGYVNGTLTTTIGVATPPPASTPCTAASGGKCIAVAYVNIPGQNLNNATAVNFVGLYHHGACIPVPTCPVDANGNTMKPQVFVVPVSVSGVNNSPDNKTVYPISSFTAYTQGPATLPTQPAKCLNSFSMPPCGIAAKENGPPATAYWRACVQVITEKGNVAITRTDSGATAWGQTETVAAYTRCAPANETAGSNFTVYSD